MARSHWIIGLDADDTLWHNERHFQMTHAHFADLLAPHTDAPDLMTRLDQAERRNLGHYGFGVKSFTLSMIETAIDVTEGRVPASVISELIAAGREMLAHPIELLPHVAETIAALSDHTLVVITKGDLLDQERKVAQSGLGDHFHGVEVVSDKTPQTYTTIFGRYGRAPALMAGNSLRSDVIPALQAGFTGVHIPHETTWSYEQAEPPVTHPAFHELPHFGGLPALIETLSRS